MLAQLKSFAQAFSKACSFQRQSLWSLSAESEISLGEAQHSLLLSGGFYPPHFLLLATLVNKGGLCPPLEGKEC